MAIVISEAYHDRIELARESVRLVAADGAEIGYPASDLDQLSCWIDLQPIEENGRYTDLDFESLLLQRDYIFKDPLYTLKTAGRMLNNDGLLFVNDRSRTPEAGRCAETLFSCAGFRVLERVGNCSILCKRTPFVFSVPDVPDYVVKEAETEEEIRSYLSFLSNWHPKEQNYEPKIDDLFTNQSVIFLAYPRHDRSRVMGVARYTHALPRYGYYLPLQLATIKEGKHAGEHFALPENVTSIGESLCIYDKQGTGKIGSSYCVYKQLIRAILTYKYEIAATDLSYTTYSDGNKTLEKLYIDRFGFQPTLHDNEKVGLQYGTFADQWNLLELDRATIERQYRDPERIFDKSEKRSRGEV